MRGLKDKVALVTGGAHPTGIGGAAAKRLVEEGVKVVITDLADDQGAAYAKELGAVYVHHYVSKEADWQAAIAKAVQTYGGLHILVNNAGVGTFADVEQETLEGYNKVIAINQTGVWLGMKFAVPEMRKAGGGSIVNISSIFGAVGGFGASVAYHSAKGAVRLMSKNAALRYAKENIRVNSVHPGFIDTPMIASVKDPTDPAMAQTMGAILSMTPMGRLGKPEEIGSLITFLASSDASYCTGAEFYADGGWTAM